MKKYPEINIEERLPRNFAGIYSNFGQAIGNEFEKAFPNRIASIREMIDLMVRLGIPDVEKHLFPDHEK